MDVVRNLIQVDSIPANVSMVAPPNFNWLQKHSMFKTTDSTSLLDDLTEKDLGVVISRIEADTTIESNIVDFSTIGPVDRLFYSPLVIKRFALWELNMMWKKANESTDQLTLVSNA
jgi:hypothetical protein